MNSWIQKLVNETLRHNNDMGEEWGKLTDNYNAQVAKDEENKRLLTSGRITEGEYALRKLGAAGATLGDVVARTGDALTPDFITDPIADKIEQGITWGMDASGATDYLRDNPRFAGNLEGGLGLLDAAGLKGVKAFNTKSKDRGGVLSTPSNYIDNFYGIDRPDLPNSRAEDAVEAAISGATSVNDSSLGIGLKLPLGKAAVPLSKRLDLLNNPEKKTALARKIVGFANWGKNSVFPLLKNLGSAEAKALWREQGINKNGQKLIKDLLDQAEAKVASGKTTDILSTREMEKAVAQSIYMRYIGEQAGRKGNYSKDYQEVFDKSTFGGIMPNSKAAYLEASGALENLATKGKGYRRINVPENQRARAYDHVQDIWGMDENSVLVVKKPKGTGGDHASSVYFSKMNGPVRSLLSTVEGKVKRQATTEELYNELINKKDLKKYKGITVLNKSLEDAMENGLWITQSSSGRAVVEGGINRVSLLKPTGEIISFISDEHNFMENLPILGPILKKSLPIREITITPPIVGHIKGNKKYTTQEAIGDEGNKVDPESLRALSEAKPTPEGVAQAKRDIRTTQQDVGMLTGSLALDPVSKTEAERLEEERINSLLSQLPN